MDIYGKIKGKIREIAGKENGYNMPVVFTAQVESVSGETCTVKLDELLITDVRLRAVINDNAEKILITPKAGSYVLIVDLSGGEYRNLAVVSYSEIENISITINKALSTMDKDGFKIESQNENLFTVISDLIGEVQKIIVVQGTSPDVPALEQIRQRLNKILK
ncbi:MAG: hypothetical protein LBC68_07750 [Prevotellaceae bacterium]|jgi:hypothetical protein|nr:hypothetical protein [Prevotellaceae bacterium]